MQDVQSTGGGRVFGDRRLRPHNHHHHHQQALKCPRCDSLNTKFCYYNNYNLSQPRHFCKNCRRYWTKGGVLRNVPVGGGCRKSKRSSSSKAKALPCPKQPPPNSHSSSESSNTTDAAGNNSSSNGVGVFQNFESENNRINNTVPTSAAVVTTNFESENNRINTGLNHLIEPGLVGEHQLIFPQPNEISELMGLMNHSSSAAAADPTASFNQFLHNQSGVHDWDVVHQEDEKMHGLVGGILDPTLRIDDLLQSTGSNGGLAALDWQAPPPSDHNGQGLFDLPSTVDHQGFWSQTTSSHRHQQWSDNTNNDHTLFFP